MNTTKTDQMLELIKQLEAMLASTTSGEWPSESRVVKEAPNLTALIKVGLEGPPDYSALFRSKRGSVKP